MAAAFDSRHSKHIVNQHCALTLCLTGAAYRLQHSPNVGGASAHSATEAQAVVTNRRCGGVASRTELPYKTLGHVGGKDTSPKQSERSSRSMSSCSNFTCRTDL